jgi:hypothetical protein
MVSRWGPCACHLGGGGVGNAAAYIVTLSVVVAVMVVGLTVCISMLICRDRGRCRAHHCFTGAAVVTIPVVGAGMTICHEVAHACRARAGRRSLRTASQGAGVPGQGSRFRNLPIVPATWPLGKMGRGTRRPPHLVRVTNNTSRTRVVLAAVTVELQPTQRPPLTVGKYFTLIVQVGPLTIFRWSRPAVR